MARLLGRLPRTHEQAQALTAVLGMRAGDVHEVHEDDAAKLLGAVEDAASQRCTLRVDYYSSSRGEHALRDLSIHRVMYGDRVRAVATCHRTHTLKFFRVDEMRTAKLTTTPFQAVSNDEVDAFVQNQY